MKPISLQDAAAGSPDTHGHAKGSEPAWVHRRFEAQVEADPDRLALVCGGESLAYRQLNRRANRLAHYLRGKGVGPSSLVGICMHRSVEMIVALLGVLKAGGAYVPLDPAYPRQRLAAMVGDIELKVLLTTDELATDLPESAATVVRVDLEARDIESESQENPELDLPPETLAYAIFTSGSTGRAKAAAVHQAGWANLLDWFGSEFEIGPEDRVLVISSFSFDITQRSIAMPLVVGGELHLLDSRLYDPGLIRKTIAREEITLLNCAPSTFYPLVECGREERALLRGARVVFLGGEPISASRLRDWAESPDCAAEVANVYGVAECSDVSSFHRLRDYDRYVKASVPAGKPIFETEIHLLDEDLMPVAPGERGEICIAGAGVGKGYVNDTELTLEKFVVNPLRSRFDSLLYRTGDLGRLAPDGALELIGRVDHQVKIRGNRIDLGDVESGLRAHPSVREAVVVSKAFETGDVRLLAYVVFDDPAASEEEEAIVALREAARELLPGYMVPSRFVPIEELPLNPNGKVDRIALTEREVEVALESPDTAARSPREEVVARTFAEVLDMERVGIHDNFFDLGGDSYLVTILLGRLDANLGARISIFDFVSKPSVAEVMELVEAELEPEELVPAADVGHDSAGR
jgi:amino acid adenylation domain-containing protein